MNLIASHVNIQQKGITMKNKTSSIGRFTILNSQTPAGSKYQWPRQVAKTSQLPNITKISAIEQSNDLQLRQKRSGFQKLSTKGMDIDTTKINKYFDITIIL